MNTRESLMPPNSFEKNHYPLKLLLFALSIFLLAACSGLGISPTVTTGANSIPITGQSAPTAVQTGQATDQPLIPVATTQSPLTAQTAPAETCSTTAALTPAVTEGPYFKAGSPERSSLLDTSTTGVKLTLTGVVMTAGCQPVAHALLDFWQANAQGQYDNAGYTLRGHQYTDANGRYQLDTIIPGLYPGRTEHIHVKVQAPNGSVLTTQLFFPGVTNNSSDGIFDPGLLIAVQNSTGSSMQAIYNFVVSLK